MLQPYTFNSRKKHLTKGEKIKLEFSILNPSYENYSIQGKFYDNQVTDFNTEIKKSSSPGNELVFEKILVCDYFFEREQILILNIKKNNINQKSN